MKQFFTISFLLLHFYLIAQDFTTTNQEKSKKADVKSYYQKQHLNKSTGLSNKSDKPISFNGQWKGSFTDNSSGIVDYVLELDCEGSVVTGYSYTYFMGGSKRYYTICKLKGTVNRTTKELIVTEFERTKYNTPPDFGNCFQTHTVRYLKSSDDVETLEGSWIAAPDQKGGCGLGKTILTRRLMKKTTPLVNSPEFYGSNAKKSTPARDLVSSSQPPIILKPKPTLSQNKNPLKAPKPSLKNSIASNDKGLKNSIPIITPEVKKEKQVITPPPSFARRSKALLNTIEIQQDSFKVQLYDNGEIDGDSVSVFYNGSLLVSHKSLSEKPITLSLSFDRNIDVNELTLYAENLGTIPPNTALMIVTDGDKRYEVRITSDTEKNGTIAFVRKK